MLALLLPLLASTAQGASEGPAFAIEMRQEVMGSGSGFTTSPLTGKVGQTVDYEIVVRDTGNVSSSPEGFSGFTDAHCDPGTIAGGPGSGLLAPGESAMYTCSHVLTSAGSYVNEALVTGATYTEETTRTSNRVEVIVGPPAPSGVSAASSDKGAVVSWQESAGASPSGFNVREVNPNGSAGPIVATAGAGATSASVTGLRNCDSYRFQVQAVGSGSESAPSLPSGSAIPHWTPSGEPKVAVILMEGWDSKSTAESYFADSTSTPGHKGMNTYCARSDGPPGTKTVFPADLKDLIVEYNPRFERYATEATSMTDRLAGHEGTFILPWSFKGVWLENKSGGGTLVHVRDSVPNDSNNTSPVIDAETLRNEVESVHNAWKNTKIVILGHSLGGLIAEQYWEYFWRGNHQNVTRMISLDGAVNGVEDARLGTVPCSVLCGGVMQYFGALWQSIEWHDPAISSNDGDGAFLPVGTEKDQVYEPYDPQTPGIVSQMLFNCGGFPRETCTPTSPGFVSPCPSPDHAEVKGCPGVINYVETAIFGSASSGAASPSHLTVQRQVQTPSSRRVAQRDAGRRKACASAPGRNLGATASRCSSRARSRTAADARAAGVNASLESLGQISGTVTDASSGHPLAYAEVDVYDSSGNPLTSAETGADGTYTVPELPGGTYEVGFLAQGNYLEQFYNSRGSLESADHVSVTGGSTTAGINAALAPGGQISGVVTDASTGLPVGNVRIQVYDSAGSVVASGESSADGNYTISQLVAGSYRVGFLPSGNYLAQFSANRSTLAAADPVSVTSGAMTSGVNAALAAGGQITGAVSDASTSAAIGGVLVDAYDSSGRIVASAQSAADGTYSLVGLSTGSYRVEFLSPAGDRPAQFYNAASSLAIAKYVFVTAGTSTTHISIALVEGAKISGTVTDSATNAGIGGVPVSVYDSSGKVIATAQTASDGTYAVSGLTAGSYRVGFASHANHVPQYYNNSATLASATSISVSASAERAGVNAALVQGGQVGGTLIDASTNAPVPDVLVNAYDSSGAVVASTVSAADGIYTVSGLATGSYRIGFLSFNGAHAPQFSNGQTSLSAANPVAVTAGATTGNINALLAAAGKISGAVTRASDSAALAETTVTVYDSNGAPVGTAETGSDGSYTVSGLGTAAYKVGFSPSANYVSQFYSGKSTLESSETVSVTAGSTTSGVDALLTTGGQISGTVTDASTNSPIGNVKVAVYDLGDHPIALGQTAADGTYTVSGLATGNDIVEFSPTGNYVSQFYNEKPSPAAADRVSVTAGNTTSGIDAAMVVGGQITGTVTDASTMAALEGIQVCPLTSSGGSGGQCTLTNQSGEYTITGLASAEYKLEFTSASHIYPTQYYNAKALLATADQVPVTTGTLASHIDDELFMPPASTRPPTILGTPQLGQALAETHGEWTNKPTGYSYQWEECDGFDNNCAAILGATSQTYTLTLSDVGHTIRVAESAMNAGGTSTPVTSPQTAVVQVASPSQESNNSGGDGTPGGGGNTGGGSSTSVGDEGFRSVSSAQIAALLAQLVTPTGKAAKIVSLLKAGGFTLTFRALEAGIAVIGWYQIPRGVKLAKKTKARPVLVASGKLTFSAAGTATMRIKLTPAGKRLLKHTKGLKLTAKDIFTPTEETPISATTVFVLRR